MITTNESTASQLEITMRCFVPSQGDVGYVGLNQRLADLMWIIAMLREEFGGYSVIGAIEVCRGSQTIRYDYGEPLNT
jgi:hypothetical protein